MTVHARLDNYHASIKNTPCPNVHICLNMLTCLVFTTNCLTFVEIEIV